MTCPLTSKKENWCCFITVLFDIYEYEERHNEHNDLDLIVGLSWHHWDIQKIGVWLASSYLSLFVSKFATNYYHFHSLFLLCALYETAWFTCNLFCFNIQIETVSGRMQFPNTVLSFETESWTILVMLVIDWVGLSTTNSGIDKLECWMSNNWIPWKLSLLVIMNGSTMPFMDFGSLTPASTIDLVPYNLVSTSSTPYCHNDQPWLLCLAQ